MHFAVVDTLVPVSLHGMPFLPVRLRLRKHSALPPHLVRLYTAESRVTLYVDGALLPLLQQSSRTMDEEEEEKRNARAARDALKKRRAEDEASAKAAATAAAAAAISDATASASSLRASTIASAALLSGSKDMLNVQPPAPASNVLTEGLPPLLVPLEDIQDMEQDD